MHCADRTFAAIRRVLVVLTCAIVVTGCASRVVGEGDGGPADGARTHDGAITDGQDAPPDIPYRDVPRTYDVFLEDACITDVPPASRMYSCDPFATVSGCADGEACYIYIDYPQGACGMEVYRSDCFAVGSTPPDGFCTTATDCQPGYGCFITGASNRCLQLCRLDGTPPQCSMGRVCQETDLPDFGACD